MSCANSDVARLQIGTSPPVRCEISVEMEPIKEIYSETVKESRMETHQELDEETHEEVQVERHLQETRMETITTVELLEREDFPKVEKCCFCINLRLGISAWLVFESLIWIFFFVSALYHEAIYIAEDELTEFIEDTDNWYFYLIFGDRLLLTDQRIRSKFLNEKALPTVT